MEDSKGCCRAGESRAREHGILEIVVNWMITESEFRILGVVVHRLSTKSGS